MDLTNCGSPKVCGCPVSAAPPVESGVGTGTLIADGSKVCSCQVAAGFSAGSDILRPQHAEPLMSITVTFAVRNTGVIVSDEVPQLYLEWETGTGDTNWPELRGFTRLHAVPAGSSKSVTMLLTSQARAVVREDGVRVLRPGKFTVHVGGGQPLIDPRFHTSNILSAPVFVTGTEIEANTCDKY